MHSRRQKAPSSHPLFLTPKSRAAIPVRSTLQQDMLRQSALDPAVATIDFVESVMVAGTSVRLDAVMLGRGGKRRIVEIDDGACCGFRSLDDEGFYLLALKQLNVTPFHLGVDRIRREPACGNARRVWAERSRSVDMDRRLAITDLLDGRGPTSLGDIDRKFGGGVVHDVFALACETTLDIDIGRRLDRAIVKLGPAAHGRRSTILSESLHGSRT